MWSDPAVLQAEADAGHQFETWRRALATFLRRLPAERRAELRARIAGSTPASRLTVPDAS